jgi:hypothetical protein
MDPTLPAWKSPDDAVRLADLIVAA